MSEDKPSSKDTGDNSLDPVQSPNQEPSQQGVFSMKNPRRSHKKLFIVGLIVVLILAGAGIWWWMSQHSPANDKKETASDYPVLATVCDTATIQSAGRPIADNDIASLQSIADGILQKKNYRGDVNCNYILMRYYLMSGDVSKAASTLNDLSYTHGNSGGYSTAFDPPAASPSSLRDTLNVMIANNEAEQKQNKELDGLDQ